ncbi:muts domain V-domain-containing protein [Coprinopsis sp. MPI-PUGE-AT-0042]|nr:muts domain V-domain-containing protein [Coprinopsis sp. MPI-PUGE-AT-0042]
MPAKRKQREASSALESENESSRGVPPHKKKVRWKASSSLNEEDDSNDVAEQSDEEDESSADSEQARFLTSCRGRLGVAYYEPAKGIIHVLEDTQETLHFDLTRMLLEQIQPDIVLTSTKADEEFMDVLRDHVDSAGGICQIRPFKEFSTKTGRERILSLSSASSRSRNAYEFMQARGHDVDPTMQRWNAAIRLANFTSAETSPFCISSIGALIDHLVRQRAASELDDDGIAGLDVRDIQALAVSLQVFANESHASVHSDKTKEGLSLFGILNMTKTNLGRQLLRTWLLRPSLSLSTISKRHNAVECFTRPENLVAVNLMHNHLKGLKNTPKVLKALMSGKAQLVDWQGFVKFTFHTTMLRDALSELHGAGDVDVVKKLVKALDVATFKETGSKVNDTIDWEESNNAERICVRPRIDEELDNWKHAYHGIDAVLSQNRSHEDVTPDVAPALNVVYFPQLGYLICIPMRPEWRAGTPSVEGWTFQHFPTAGSEHVYFKSEEMRDMDVHIAHEASMTAACDVCAELDCLLALAHASRANNYVRPEMVQDNMIEIIGGRHPLHEQILDTFVANDARLVGGAGLGYGEDWNSILLCTGANACGKSVYMKQIALIQIMAQFSFVPAESATLGIVDKIFTRVSTRESVSKAQSAFMIDLNQVSLALRNCTSRSLILLDEFGKGTLSTDGAGLFCGVLMHLLERGSQCPKVLVATHFHEVFAEDLLDVENLPITLSHMQVMFTIGGEDGNSYMHESEGTPQMQAHYGNLLRLHTGVATGLCSESHAAQCAAMFGIPHKIVSRAQHVSDLISRHEVRMKEEEVEDLLDAEEVCRRFLEWDLDVRDGADVKKKLRWVLGISDEDAGDG